VDLRSLKSALETQNHTHLNIKLYKYPRYIYKCKIINNLWTLGIYKCKITDYISTLGIYKCKINNMIILYVCYKNDYFFNIIYVIYNFKLHIYNFISLCAFNHKYIYVIKENYRFEPWKIIN
jgi:hypothetical protein